jgi:hypothetical protein
VESPPGLDALESEPLRRTPIVLAVVVVVATLTLLVAATGGSGHPGRAGRVGRVSPTPSPPVGSAMAARSRLAVLFEPLPGCTHVSADGHVHAAMAITDFSDQPVRVLAAAATGSPAGLQLASVRLGRRSCGADGSTAPVPLPAWREMVVALDVASATRCPAGSFGLRVTFDTPNGIRHAESSSVVDLTDLPGCA